MSKTLFIASFPDLGSFDFSKTGIKVGNVDNSDFFFNNSNTYVHSYIESLKSFVGTCDVLFVPTNDHIISSLASEGIKCIVLYPNKDSKGKFLEDLSNSKIEDDFISMIDNSWDFIISRLERHNYDYKFVLGEEDQILDVLNSLISKREVLGVSRNDISFSINDSLVNDLFSYCLLREDEMFNGRPSIQSVFCEGIMFDCFFSAKRLEDKKKDISLLINNIKGVDEGVSANDLGVLKNGRVWTDSSEIIEKVMVLGVGNGDLVIPFSRHFDHTLKGKAPYVIKASALRARL